MNLQKIIDELKLELLTQPLDFSDVNPQGGYSSDLLSWLEQFAKGYG